MTATEQLTDRTDLAVELPTAPARRALVEYARRRRLSMDQLSDVLHLDDIDVPALVERRWLPWHLADRVAVALGRHPCELWPEWFEGRPARRRDRQPRGRSNPMTAPTRTAPVEFSEPDGPDGRRDRPRLLSIEDVADYLRVSPRWVYTQVRTGRLPAMLIARSWRIRPEVLDDFAESFRSGSDDRFA